MRSIAARERLERQPSAAFTPSAPAKSGQASSTTSAGAAPHRLESVLESPAAGGKVNRAALAKTKAAKRKRKAKVGANPPTVRLRTPRPVRKPTGRLVKSNLPALEQEGRAGGFFRGSQFALTGGLTGPGLIVQKITRDADIRRVKGGAKISHAEIDRHNTSSTTSTNLSKASSRTYYEAWQIHSGETEPRRSTATEPDDEFAFPTVKIGNKFVNQTKGQFTIKGEAHFHPTPHPPSHFGFTVDPSSPAGILPFSATPPTGLPAASHGPVTHTVTSSWDSGKKKADDRYSDVQESFT